MKCNINERTKWEGIKLQVRHGLNIRSFGLPYVLNIPNLSH